LQLDFLQTISIRERLASESLRKKLTLWNLMKQVGSFRSKAVGLFGRGMPCREGMIRARGISPDMGILQSHVLGALPQPPAEDPSDEPWLWHVFCRERCLFSS
jgi:hypothetical protein